MEKQKKQIITRKQIEKDLLFNNTASIKHTAVCLAAVTLALGVVSAVFLFLFLPTGFLWLDVIIWVFFVGIIGAPIWAISIMLIKTLIERKHLKNGELEIVIRPLLYKDEKLVRGYTLRPRTQKMLQFGDFEDVWADPNYYQLCTMDDEFYIVHYKGSKKAEIVFPLKMYELKEDKE